MTEIFETKTNYNNILNTLIFSKRNVKTVRYGLQTISYMEPKKLENCPYRLSRTYRTQIDFIT